MLSNNPPVTTSRRNSQPLRHQKPKSTRIQIGPTPQNAILRQSTQFPRHIREYINRIAYDEQQSVRRVFH